MRTAQYLRLRIIRFFHFFSYLNVSTIRKIVVRSGNQRLPGLAAEIAFNAMLAMFPAIVAVLTVIGILGRSESAFKQLTQQLSQVAPTDVLNLVQAFVGELGSASNQNLLSISFIATLWLASGAVGSAMSALDRIHQIPPQKIRSFWRAKLVAIGLTFGTILLLVAASVMVFISDLIVQVVAYQSDQIVETIAKQPNVMKPQLLTLWARLSMPIALGMVAAGFAFIYRFGPSRCIKGAPILPGAVLATLSWAFFSRLFSLYVSNFGSYNRIYGALGTVIVLLLWLQLGALMMLIGAQLNVTVGEMMPFKAPVLPDIAQYRQKKASKK
jgi:membrane protein